MRYSELAEIYEELEKTSSKLKKADIIAKLLKKTSTNLLDKIVLLLSGWVFPPWSPYDLGIAYQQAIKAIAKATGTTPERVVNSFKKGGDLGDTVASLISSKSQKTLRQKPLNVEDVFSNLQKLAEHTGEGSQERKQNLVVELLARAEPNEARYIIRTLLGQLRVGVAEGIVRDAISKAFDVDAEKLENAWYMRPDYGELAVIAKEKGNRGLEKISLKLGEPIMVQLAEKAPTLKDALESFKKPALQYKYDGMRHLDLYTQARECYQCIPGHS